MLNRNVIIGLVGAGLLAIGAVFAWMALQQQDRDDRGVAAKPPAASAPAQPQETATAEPVRPTFDVVRVNPAGDAVLAGRAAPNAKVHILDGEREIGSVTADARGEWVFVPTDPLPPGSRELSLSARVGDQDVRSDQVVVIAVPERGTATADAGQPLVVATSRSGQGVSRVLQGPGANGNGALSLDVVGVDAGGALSMSGRAPPNATVQVYMDNKLLGRAVAGADGRWQLSPTEHAPLGSATLRLDQLGENGQVVMRMELPFTRNEEVADADGTHANLVTVKSGDSLWRIARRIHGRGMAYLMIYQANKEQIRDPDLIYPGQVFHVTRLN